MNWWWSSVSCSRLSASLGGGSMTSLLITQHCSRAPMMLSYCILLRRPDRPAEKIVHRGGAKKPWGARARRSALDGAADVPGAEHELLHLDCARKPRKVFPRPDQRIAEHRVLHQPEAEWQHQPPAEPVRNLGVHDHQPAARPQLIPGFPQHREVVRHGVVGQAEHHAVERDRRPVLGRVAFDQLDVAPVIAAAKRGCPPEHAGRDVDAIDPPLRSDRLAQEREVSAGSAADLEHMVTRPKLQATDGFGAESWGLEEQVVEQRYKVRQTVIPLSDQTGRQIDPLVLFAASRQHKFRARTRVDPGFRHDILLWPYSSSLRNFYTDI